MLWWSRFPKTENAQKMVRGRVSEQKKSSKRHVARFSKQRKTNESQGNCESEQLKTPKESSGRVSERLTTHQKGMGVALLNRKNGTKRHGAQYRTEKKIKKHGGRVSEQEKNRIRKMHKKA